MYCPADYHFQFNQTFSDVPFCVLNDLLESDWYSEWYDYWEAAHSSQSSYTTEEVEPPSTPNPVIKAQDLCRIGTIQAYCSMDICQNRTISCSDGMELTCPPNHLVISGSSEQWTATCNGKELFCISHPPCDISQRPCYEDETCSSQVYECSESNPNDCKYNTYACADACWVRVSVQIDF